MKLNWGRRRLREVEETDGVDVKCPKRAKKEDDNKEEVVDSEEVSPLVSFIVPVHNAMPWLKETFESVLKQTYKNLEVSVWNDASSDGSKEELLRWKRIFKERNIKFVISGVEENPLGAGAARNQCVKQCTGTYLCILDADDVCQPTRVERQLKIAKKYKNAIVGSGFTVRSCLFSNT